MIFIILSILSIAAIIAGNMLYKHQGEKEVFSLDLVQFIYLFIFTPLFFVWSKTFLFYVLKNELYVGLKIGEMFAIDTVFSLIFFLIFVAVSIHTLTKTFRLKKMDDPDFDIFQLSEYFHLWWTHVVIFLGGMIVLTFISVGNVFFPFEQSGGEILIIILMFVGSLLGFAFYLMVWNSDPKQHRKFIKLMNILFAIFAVIHLMIYLLIDINFSLAFAAYWFMFGVFITAVFSAMVFEKSEFAKKMRLKIIHHGWGNNIELFGSDEK